MPGGALLFFGLKVGNDASTNGFRGVFYESEGLKKIDSLFDLIAIKTGTDSTILLPCRSITQPFARCNLVLALQSIPSIALAINFQLLCSAACLLSVC